MSKPSKSKKSKSATTKTVEDSLFESPEFPIRRIRCALFIKEVTIEVQEDGTEEKNVIGLMKMETMPDFQFWFAYNPKFRTPTLGKLDKNETIKDGLKRAAKSRIRAGLKILANEANGLSNLELNRWLMVTVEEENFFGN